MLISIALANALNNSLGVGFQAIATASAEYFDTNSYGINGLLAVQFAVMIVLNFPAQVRPPHNRECAQYEGLSRYSLD